VYIEVTGALVIDKVILIYIYIYETNFLVHEVLGACHNAGLHVVATICDMDAKGIKALQLLSATRQKPFFKFWNQDILTVYQKHFPQL